MPVSLPILSNTENSLSRLDSHTVCSGAAAQSVSLINDAVKALSEKLLIVRGWSWDPAPDRTNALAELFLNFDVQFVRHAIEQCAKRPDQIHPLQNIEADVDPRSVSLIFKSSSLVDTVKEGLRYECLNTNTHGVFRVEQNKANEDQQLLFMRQSKPNGLRHLERYHYPLTGTAFQQKYMNLVESQTQHPDGGLTSKTFIHVKELYGMQAVQVAKWDKAGTPISNEAFSYDADADSMKKTDDLSLDTVQTPLLAGWEITPEQQAVLKACVEFEELARNFGVSQVTYDVIVYTGASVERLFQTNLPEAFNVEMEKLNAVTGLVLRDIKSSHSFELDPDASKALFAGVKVFTSLKVLRNTLAEGLKLPT